MRAPAFRLAVPLVLVVLLTGCSGGDDAEPSASPTPSPSTSGPAEPPEAAPRADAAVLRDGDLPDPWRELAASAGAKGVESDSCLARTTSWAEGLLDGGRVQGAIHRRGNGATYARADGYAFAAEPAAVAFLDDLRGEKYRACRAERLTAENAAAPGAAEGSSYRIGEVRDAEGEGEGGFELQVRYQFQAQIDGELQDGNGFRDDIVFRDGATVVVVLFEHVFAEGEPPELVGTAADELVAGVQTALARAAREG